MLSALRAAEIDGQKLSNWDLLGFCFVFIAGGNDTTNHMLANALVRLQEHPEQRALLVANPERIGPAVEEFLRFDAPVQGLSRTLTGDLELHGQRLREGAKVHLLYASANRDPRQYGERASELDVMRDVQRHMSFTQGPHFCIGAHLARMMGRIGLEELLLRFPEYRLDLTGAVRTRSAFVRGFDVLPFHAA
jgi:cytochrome P450